MLTLIYRENQSLEEEGIVPNNLSQIPPNYPEGELDGKTNRNPVLTENWEYWSGYSQGNREYWCKRRGIELAEEF